MSDVFADDIAIPVKMKIIIKKLILLATINLLY